MSEDDLHCADSFYSSSVPYSSNATNFLSTTPFTRMHTPYVSTRHTVLRLLELLSFIPILIANGHYFHIVECASSRHKFVFFRIHSLIAMQPIV